MMICPEEFYEHEIKGKTPEQILRKIAGWKREIAKLKRTMEHPDYAPLMCPSEDTRLRCYRSYLDRAKQVLTEVGAEYVPTVTEQRVMDFDANVGSIEKITLSIGGFFGGWSRYTVRLDEQLHFRVENTVAPASFDIHADKPMTKKEFLEQFSELHVGEWRKNYSTERFGYMVCDGTQWDLTVEYDNGRKAFTTGGSNAFPYNFKKLTELLGIEAEGDKE